MIGAFSTLRFRCCGPHGTASRPVLSCNAPGGRRSKKHRRHKWRLHASFALGSSKVQPNFRFSPLPLETNTRRNDAEKSRHRWRRLNCFFPNSPKIAPFPVFLRHCRNTTEKPRTGKIIHTHKKHSLKKLPAPKGFDLPPRAPGRKNFLREKRPRTFCAGQKSQKAFPMKAKTSEGSICPQRRPLFANSP